MAGKDQALVRYHERRFKELKAARLPWEPLWQMLADHVEPSRLRLNASGNKPVTRANILDPTGTRARKTMASGMHSDITSPARKWFKLKLPKNDPLAEDQEVKTWLDGVTDVMHETFGASNVYSMLHSGYGDLGLFGQPCIVLASDDDEVVRAINPLHGTFWLGRNHKGVADTLYRQFRWSADKIVQRWGEEGLPQKVLTAYRNDKLDDTFIINHAIEPRTKRNEKLKNKANMPFTSNYWLDAGHEGRMLEVSGFEENPILAPAWELAGEDTYSISPMQEVIGALRALQKENLWKLEAIEKKVRPPLVGPAALRNDSVSLLPAGITYIDGAAGGAELRPIFAVDLPLGDLREEINETRGIVERAMFVDLFMMLSQMEGIQPRNQMEIHERKAEKMLALGPVLENIHNGLLKPMIERMFGLCLRASRLPVQPEKLVGKDVEVEYISILAQAQKASGTGSIERLLSLAGNLSAVAPEVLDGIDTDVAFTEYAEMIGVPQKMMRSKEDIQAIRQSRADAAKAQADAESMVAGAQAMNQGAQAAQVLADTAANNPAGGALLSRIGLQ